nr:MAG TPA: hypothetical protein [Bacteriophage sp.]
MGWKCFRYSIFLIRTYPFFYIFVHKTRKGISELESMGNSSGRNTGVPYVCIQESRCL